MIHIDLFSGIGGFSYAADQVWDDVEHIFCEINPFCQQVLKKHWKGATIYGDIRQLTADTESNRLNSIGGEVQKGRVRKTGIRDNFLLTGGFPCQPFSTAGQRKGADDQRFLWPEMLRVIKEFKPAWIIGENVAGILSMAQYEGDATVGSETDLFGNKQDIHTHEGRGILYGIIEQLGEIGYSVQTFVIPACAVNAPHRRDRVWIVAHSKGAGAGSNEGGLRDKFIRESGRSATDSNAPDAERAKCQGERRNSRSRRPEFRCGDWEQPWIKVATELCRVDARLSAGVDGLKLSAAGHRVERLKSLGNAIVPQVAIEIMRAIKQAVR